MVKRYATLCVVACLLLFGPAAHAEKTAKVEFQKGWKALNNGDFEKALGHYERSYEEQPRSRTLYNIALCEENLRRYGAAISHYQEFLNDAETRDSQFFADARTRITALKQKIGAKVHVTSKPSGALVSIRGKKLGHTPLQVDLTAGKHMLVLSRRGTRSSERLVEVRAGKDQVVDFSLDKVGHVHLSVSPADALIRRKDVDDAATGVFDADLSPGTYDFEVSLIGHRTQAFSVQVKADSVVKRAITLSARHRTGALRILSDASDANVSVDGIVVGSTQLGGGGEAELQRRLPAGQHTLIVESRDGLSWSKRFHLSPGETFSATILFSKSSKSRNYASWGLAAAGVVSLATGVTYGILALNDVKSVEMAGRAGGRALIADVMYGIAGASLAGAWYLRGSDSPAATIDRSHEDEPDSI